MPSLSATVNASYVPRSALRHGLVVIEKSRTCSSYSACSSGEPSGGLASPRQPAGRRPRFCRSTSRLRSELVDRPRLYGSVTRLRSTRSVSGT